MSATVTFLDFAQRVQGQALTPAQRPLCRVSIDRADPIDLEDDERELARELLQDVERIPDIARKVVVWRKGRGVGGTWLGALACLWAMLTADCSGLQPGEPAFCISVAPDKATARQALRFALGAAKAVPAIARLIVREWSDGFEIRRPDGAVAIYEVCAASRAGSSIRGRDILVLHMTEAAFHGDSDYQVNAEAIFAAGRPRVRLFVLLESSPWLQAGLLYQLDHSNFGKPRTAVVAHCPTGLMRPDPETQAMIAAERERDPVVAARELDAEYVSAGSEAWFDPAAVEQCTVDRPRCLPHARTVHVAAGVDLGFRNDASALVVVHRDGELIRVAETVELRPEKGRPLVPSAVVGTFAEVAKRHGVRTLVADLVYVESLRELAAHHGLSVTTAPQGQCGKVAAYTTARNLLAEGRVDIAKGDKRLLAQLREVVGKPTQGGSFSITSPRRRGSHGDLAAAAVLALHHLDRHRSTLSPGYFRRGRRRLGGALASRFRDVDPRRPSRDDGRLRYFPDED